METVRKGENRREIERGKKKRRQREKYGIKDRDRKRVLFKGRETEIDIEKHQLRNINTLEV